MTNAEAKNVLQEQIDKYGQEYDEKGIEALKVAIEVLEKEPKTGRWTFTKVIMRGKRMWCSNCNSAFDLCCNQVTGYDFVTKKEFLWTYCPWCGAKMESEDMK